MARSNSSRSGVPPVACRAIAFARRVVEELAEHVAFLDWCAEIHQEPVLRVLVHHQVLAGDQQPRGRVDRAAIRDHALGDLVEAGRMFTAIGLVISLSALYEAVRVLSWASTRGLT
jgi:hypothetical protein